MRNGKCGSYGLLAKKRPATAVSVAGGRTRGQCRLSWMLPSPMIPPRAPAPPFLARTILGAWQCDLTRRRQLRQLGFWARPTADFTEPIKARSLPVFTSVWRSAVDEMDAPSALMRRCWWTTVLSDTKLFHYFGEQSKGSAWMLKLSSFFNPLLFHC